MKTMLEKLEKAAECEKAFIEAALYLGLEAFEGQVQYNEN